MYDLNQIRTDFPILSREVYGKPLVYLDNAATTQKPLCVLDAMRDEYLNVNANVHRGVHYLSQKATDLHEAAREKVRQFINAKKIEEIVFTRGTTEAINLVASSFCESQMQPGDEVIVTEMEHHSNIVSWQLQAMKRGIIVKHIPITDEGILCLDQLETLMTERTKIISVAHVSNVLGTVNPVEDIISMAHAHGIPVLVDGAQSAPHFKVDVQAMDCDFFAFSGHKMYGPTGIGVLYGKEGWLEKLPPYQGGGEMIDKVTWEKTTFERLPFKFEAGTPDYVARNVANWQKNTDMSKWLNGASAEEMSRTTDFGDNNHVQTDKPISKIFGFEDDMKEADSEFHNYLQDHILNSYVAQCMDGKASYIIKQLVKAYLTNPQQLPDKTIISIVDDWYQSNGVEENNEPYMTMASKSRERLKSIMNKDDPDIKAILLRRICDFIAGMTDQFAMNCFERLYAIVLRL